MASTTRVPTGADLACLHCHSPNDIDLDHVVNRGMGGSKERDVPENKVPLCRGCHVAKTVGTIKTRVKDGVYYWHKADSDLVFRVPVEISERYGCLIASDGAEPTNVDGPGPEFQHSSAPSLAGEGPLPAASGSQDRGDDPLDGPQSPSQGPPQPFP